jgi:hypothetical protein
MLQMGATCRSKILAAFLLWAGDNHAGRTNTIKRIESIFARPYFMNDHKEIPEISLHRQQRKNYPQINLPENGQAMD